MTDDLIIEQLVLRVRNGEMTQAEEDSVLWKYAIDNVLRFVAEKSPYNLGHRYVMESPDGRFVYEDADFHFLEGLSGSEHQRFLSDVKRRLIRRMMAGEHGGKDA